MLLLIVGLVGGYLVRPYVEKYVGKLIDYVKGYLG